MISPHRNLLLAPGEQHPLQPADERADQEAEHRDRDDAGHQLVGLHEIAGREQQRADAGIGADHLGRDHQDQGDRGADATTFVPMTIIGEAWYKIPKIGRSV